MGLAAGINFSMRSVLVTDTRYLAGNFERQVQPDELLQMFGRAGRRGLDDTGFILFTPDQPRLSYARPRQLKRATQVDWPSLISVMRSAAQRGEQPFTAAVALSRSLFSVQQVPLGTEHSLATGTKPCGLWVDAERARFVRRPIVEILNSREEWEPRGEMVESSLGEALLREGERLILRFGGRKRSSVSRSATSAACARRKSMAAKRRSRPPYGEKPMCNWSNRYGKCSVQSLSPNRNCSPKQKS